MKLEDIKALVNTINQSNIEKFKFKNNEVELEIFNSKGVDQIRETPVNNIKTVNQATQDSSTENSRVENKETIKSPLVGVFYEASSPNDDPYVVEGQRVKKGDVLCIVEAMKVMNEIVAKEDCTIKKVLVPNEAIVEYAQDLFIIE